MPIKSTIGEINEILSTLPESALHKVRNFVFYLADRDKRHKGLVERVLKAEKERPIRFKSVEDAVKAVFDETAN